MFGLDLPQLLILALVGFVCVGPERLPTLARDAGRVLRQLRQMADGASAELRAQLPNAEEYGLGNVESIRDLHPKRVITRALWDADEGPDLLGTRPAGQSAARATRRASTAPRVSRDPGTPPPYDLDAT